MNNWYRTVLLQLLDPDIHVPVPTPGLRFKRLDGFKIHRAVKPTGSGRHVKIQTKSSGALHVSRKTYKANPGKSKPKADVPHSAWQLTQPQAEPNLANGFSEFDGSVPRKLMASVSVGVTWLQWITYRLK